MGTKFNELLMEIARARAASANEAVLRRDYAAAQAHASTAEACAAVVSVAHLVDQERENRELLYGTDESPVARPDVTATGDDADVDPVQDLAEKGAR